VLKYANQKVFLGNSIFVTFSCDFIVICNRMTAVLKCENDITSVMLPIKPVFKLGCRVYNFSMLLSS